MTMTLEHRSVATVFHIDPSPVWRQGFAQALEGTEFDVVGATADAREALETLRKSPVEIVVSEAEPLGMSGFEFLERLLVGGFRGRFVFVTADVSPILKNKAKSLGAAATLAKGLGEEELLRMLRKIRTGKSLWRKRDQSEEIRDSDVATHRLSLLTARERETLLLLTRGMTNRQIADELQISYETVKEHVQHILRKLPAEDRTQAAIWAVQNGLE